MHFSTHLSLVKGNPWHIPLPCALLLGVVGFLAISLTSPSSARLALPATESSSSSPQLVIKNFHSTKIERVGRQTKHLFDQPGKARHGKRSKHTLHLHPSSPSAHLILSFCTTWSCYFYSMAPCCSTPIVTKPTFLSQMNHVKPPILSFYYQNQNRYFNYNFGVGHV